MAIAFEGAYGEGGEGLTNELRALLAVAYDLLAANASPRLDDAPRLLIAPRKARTDACFGV